MKKKHELLKYAYDNYPKGTRFSNLGLKNETSISSGVFHIDDYGVRDSETSCYVLGTHNKWAEIIEQPKSILDGKCAIQVSNEREFELLMKHYEEKGWKWNSGKRPTDRGYNKTDNCIDYHDDFAGATKDYQKQLGYTIIPFSEFAKEVGIEVPKEIEVPLFNKTLCAVVNEKNISIQYCEGVGNPIVIAHSDIEAIYNAIQQLKGGGNA